MGKPKFTKGDWKANGRLIYSGSTFIATSSVTDVEWKECEANAALIAAAPDMYDALASIENDGNQVPAWLWDKIQDTLAKARGEK